MKIQLQSNSKYTSEIKCDECPYTANSPIGLKVHKGIMHEKKLGRKCLRSLTN